MEEERSGINIARQLFMMGLGGLVGVALALLYAPSSGENTRRYLRMRTEQARRRAHDITGRIKENIESLIEDVKETTDELIAEGVELTKDKKAEFLAAIEAGKRTIEEEKKRFEQLGSGEKDA